MSNNQMIAKEDIINIIYELVEEANLSLEDDKKINCKPDETLFGSKGKLDSLGLVTLIVQIEEVIDERYNISITIANEKAFSEHRSPFKTIESLANYIFELINDVNR